MKIAKNKLIIFVLLITLSLTLANETKRHKHKNDEHSNNHQKKRLFSGVSNFISDAYKGAKKLGSDVLESGKKIIGDIKEGTEKLAGQVMDKFDEVKLNLKHDSYSEFHNQDEINKINPEVKHQLSKAYNPDNNKYLLIIDNSKSLLNRYEDGRFTRLQVLQNSLDHLVKSKKKINFCIAHSMLNHKRKNEFYVKIVRNKSPPKIFSPPKETRLGIKECLDKVAKIELSMGGPIYTHIHIITDGYYHPKLNFSGEVEGLLHGKIFSADIIGEDIHFVDTLRKWVLKANGELGAVSYHFEEIKPSEGRRKRRHRSRK